MIRCASCQTIQNDGVPFCTACGAAIGASGASGAGAATPPTQHQAFVPAPAPAPAPAPSPTPSPTPLHQMSGAAGPVVLGPSSDPGLGAHTPVPPAGDLTSHTVGNFAVSSPPPLLVGPAPAGDSNATLKVAALVVSSLVLVVLVALIAFFVRQRGEEARPAPVTQPPATQPATVPTPTPPPTPPANESVSIVASSPKVTSGEAVSLPVQFTGDPAQVEATTLVMNGIPTPDTSQGLRNQFTFPTTFPGTVQLKVLIVLKGSRSIESNVVSVTVDPKPAPTPAPTVYTPPNPTPTPRGSSYPSAAPVNRWVSMVGSKPSRSVADSVAGQVPGSIVVRSDDIPSLRSGYWVVFTGSFSTGEEALANCRALGRFDRDDCYASYLSTNPADASRAMYP